MEAINRIDAVKPNVYGQEEKLRWLSVLDGIVKKEIIDTHEGAQTVPPETGTEAELLAPYPYDDMYIHWLEAQIDYAGGEYGKYNSSMAMFKAIFEAFEKYYHRSHKPIAKGFLHF
jgi:hypothetical protein